DAAAGAEGGARRTDADDDPLRGSVQHGRLRRGRPLPRPGAARCDPHEPRGHGRPRRAPGRFGDGGVERGADVRRAGARGPDPPRQRRDVLPGSQRAHPRRGGPAVADTAVQECPDPSRTDGEVGGADVTAPPAAATRARASSTKAWRAAASGNARAGIRNPPPPSNSKYTASSASVMPRTASQRRSAVPDASARTTPSSVSWTVM